MCFFKSPEKPKLPPVPDAPTRESEATSAAAADQRRQLKFRAGQAATKLSGPLGDPNFGSNFAYGVRATSLGGV
jgi:hypothetical protein